MIVDNLRPPYYAVIFTALLQDDIEGYSETATEIANLAKEQRGFLGMESVRNDLSITVSYWQNLEDITLWKNNIEHTEARNLGRKNGIKNTNLEFVK